MQKALEIIKNSTDFSKIRFIALYGSVATGESTIHSDIDITISCTMERLEAELYRISLLSELPEKIALNIFENLPLYIRKSVLGGVFLYMQDEDELYNRHMLPSRNKISPSLIWTTITATEMHDW